MAGSPLEEIKEVLQQILEKLPEPGVAPSGGEGGNAPALSLPNPLVKIFDSVVGKIESSLKSVTYEVEKLFDIPRKLLGAFGSGGDEGGARGSRRSRAGRGGGGGGLNPLEGEPAEGGAIAEAEGGEVAGAAGGAAGAAGGEAAAGAAAGGEAVAAGALGGPIGLAIGAAIAALGSKKDSGGLVGMLGPVGDSIKLIAQPFQKLYDVTIGTIKGIQKFGESTLEASRDLAQYSGKIAAIFAQSDVQDQLRAQRVGEATAGSTGTLAESLQELKTAMEPIVEFLANVGNTFATAVVKIATLMANILGPLFTVLDKLWRVLTEILYFLTAHLVDLRPDDKPHVNTPAKDFLSDWAAGRIKSQGPFDPKKKK